MNLPIVTRRYDNSDLRCPYDGKRMILDAGQHETDGDLTIRHECLHCGHFEDATRNPTVAAKTTARPFLARTRDRVRAGVEVPMRTDLPAEVEVEAW
ncbi:MAG TPA: hypothetical protein VIV56_14105 [Gemmatimonadales bacterium]